MSADEKQSQQDELLITRRRLLKTLGITAGTVAASAMIPGKWIKPIVDVGVLPAHAQLSPACQYTLVLEVFAQSGAQIPSGGSSLAQAVNLVATVTPDPGDGSVVTFDVTITPAGGGVEVGQTVSGIATIFNHSFGLGTNDGETIFATFDCATSNTWTQDVLPPP